MTDNTLEKKWFVGNTKPVKEFFSARQLEKRGIEAFCPKIKEHYCRNGRIEKRIKPLFSGYIFVKILLEEEYYKVKWTYGVKSFVGCGSKPTPLNDEFLQFIRKLTNKEGLISKRRVKQGDKVKIKSGPLMDLIGIVENDVSPSGRVKILMELVSYSARIEVPEALLEAL